MSESRCESKTACGTALHCEHWYDGFACCACSSPAIYPNGYGLEFEPTVYFDGPGPTKFRRFKRHAHLYTDGDTAFLDAFAVRIGMKPAWRQHNGLAHEHYDIFDGKIAAARIAGAVEPDCFRHIIRVMRAKNLVRGIPLHNKPPKGS